MQLELLAQENQKATEALAQGSKSFYAAAFFLAAPIRKASTIIYAYCRQADDAIDKSSQPLEALGHLQQQLKRIYDDGYPHSGLDALVHEVVKRYDLPQTLFLALLEGFYWDTQKRNYSDLSALKNYAARVAGSVGALMARIMGVSCPQMLACACELGIAMQLSNIVRDIADDAAIGRLYLPTSWMQEEGLDVAAFLKKPSYSQGLQTIIKRLLQEADSLYENAEKALLHLPARNKIAMQAARLLYREIGYEVLRAKHQSLIKRSVVALPRKCYRLLQALLVVCAKAPQELPLQTSPEVSFLVESLTKQHYMQHQRVALAYGQSIATR